MFTFFHHCVKWCKFKRGVVSWVVPYGNQEHFSHPQQLAHLAYFGLDLAFFITVIESFLLLSQARNHAHEASARVRGRSLPNPFEFASACAFVESHAVLILWTTIQIDIEGLWPNYNHLPLLSATPTYTNSFKMILLFVFTGSRKLELWIRGNSLHERLWCKVPEEIFAKTSGQRLPKEDHCLPILRW